jgi:hypothetical protein
MVYDRCMLSTPKPPNTKRRLRPPSPAQALTALRWAARWLYDEDEDWFVEGCGDIAVLLEAFAVARGFLGVHAVGGAAGNKRGLYPHAWLDVDGARYDPRADVEKLRITTYEPTRNGLDLLVSEWPGGEDADGGDIADARLADLLAAYDAHSGPSGH